MPSYLSATELAAALTLRDLSDPEHGHHAMQIVLGDVVTALKQLWDIPADVIRQSPLVSVADNYDELGFDSADVTREALFALRQSDRDAPEPHLCVHSGNPPVRGDPGRA